MKKLLIALLVTFSPGHLVAEIKPALMGGVWLTGDGNSLIELSASDQTVSATVMGAIVEDPNRATADVENPDPALRSRPLIGLPIFSGFKYDGEGRWSGGTIYDPNNGKTYNCIVTIVDENTLNVRGYIGISVFGRTEVWTRRQESPASR